MWGVQRARQLAWSWARRDVAKGVREDLWLIDDLARHFGGADRAWDRRRREYLYASVRVVGVTVSSDGLRSRLAVGIVLASIPVLYVALRDAWQADVVGSLLGQSLPAPAALLAGVLVLVILNNWAVRVTARVPVIRLSRSRRRAVMLALPGFLYASAPLITSVMDQRSTLGFFWQGCFFGATVLLYVHAASAFVEFRRTRQIHQRCRPTDRLLLTTLTLAGGIHVFTRGRVTPATCRLLWATMESAAHMAERDLAVPYRLPRSLRGTLRQEALRIASVYRAHMMPLALVRTPADGDRLVASLLAAADALIDGDRAALLENAPEKVTKRRIVRAVLVRAWPPVVLIACGIGLPLIPSVAAQGALASSLRWTLVVAGVLTFVAGSDTASRVSGPLDKALPWK